MLPAYQGTAAPKVHSGEGPRMVGMVGMVGMVNGQALGPESPHIFQVTGPAWLVNQGLR